MEKVTQDFEFTSLYSAPYGRWLATVYEAFPDVTVIACNDWYPSVANTVYASVTVPEDIAMLLKLQFGAHLVERPFVHPSELEKAIQQLKEDFLMKKFFKNPNIKNKYCYDYETCITDEKMYEGIVLKDYYNATKSKTSKDWYK